MCVWQSSLLLRGGVHSVHVAIAFVHRERGGASVCLSREFVGSSFTLPACSRRFRIRSFWTASVEPANMYPAVSLTPESSTAVFHVCCGTVISRSSRRSRLSAYLLFSPTLFNRDRASLYQRALSGLPETITQLELQSSSFAWTRLLRYWQLGIWLAPPAGAAI